MTLLLGSAVVSFIAYTARAEGDDFIGEPPPALPQPADTMPELPDIILITVDTLRADRLGIYGHLAADTPNIDAMGRSGVVFANTTVPLPRTTPGLASLLTGLDTDGHKSREVWAPVRVSKGQRLAEAFGNAGYVTLGLSANSAAGTKQGLAVGFDKFLDHGKIKRKHKRTDADIITSQALELVDGADPESPVFLWVHYVDPHWPYKPPKKWKNSPKAPKCRELQKKIKSHKLSLGNMFSNADGLATEVFDECVALYDAEVAFTDHEVGRLIEGLRERGRWDESVRVFSADHGENMGEDGLYFAHGPSLADAALRVPLIIAGPTIPAGRYDGGISRIEDVAPTLLELAQIDRKLWPKVFDGNSLQWRWSDEGEYPSEVPAYAAAESGGALHPDTTAYVVSGRKRQKYCYNGPRYSMCFTAKGKSKPKVVIKPSGAEDDDEGEGEDDHGHDAPPEVADGAPALDEDFEFFDRQTDPFEKTPLETIPQDALAELLDAKKRWTPESTRLRAIRDTAYKLVAYPKMAGGYRYALYDLRNDPSESTDVKDTHPRVYKRMKAALDDWGSSMPTFVARERSESELDELRALGYVQ